MSEFVKIKGEEQLRAFLNKLPKLTKSATVNAAADALIGDGSAGLKHLSPYKYVSRKSAYGGDGFFSDKQRRYFFAALKDGTIKTPYTRTGTLSGGWRKDIRTDQGYVRNDVGYSAYVQGDGAHGRMQTAMAKKAGQPMVKDIIQSRLRAIGEAAVKAIRAVLASQKG